MKELLLGNAAIARGLYEAGCAVASSYPGTPSTEITESIAEYDGAVWTKLHYIEIRKAVWTKLHYTEIRRADWTKMHYI